MARRKRVPRRKFLTLVAGGVIVVVGSGVYFLTRPKPTPTSIPTPTPPPTPTPTLTPTPKPTPTTALGELVESLKIMTSTPDYDPLRCKMAAIIAEELKKLGLDFEADYILYEQNVQKVIREHDFDTWIVRLTGAPERIDPDLFIHRHYTSDNDVKSGWNWMGYHNAEYDEVAAKTQISMDFKERQKHVFRCQEILYNDMPTIPIVYPKKLQAYRNDNFEIPESAIMPGEGISSFWTHIEAIPKKRRVLREGWVLPIKHFNPLAAVDYTEFAFQRLIFSRLFRMTPMGKPEPWDAEGYDLISDTEIDVYLRRDLNFHDGKPVTADDVKFSYDVHKEYKASWFVGLLEKFDKVEKRDDYTLRFHLKEPFAPFISGALAGVMILPKHIWGDKISMVEDLLKWKNENPIGSGPFKFDTWEQGNRLALKKYEGYFKPPKIEGVIRQVYNSMELMVSAIERDECDITGHFVIQPLFNQLKKMENVKTLEAPNHGLYEWSFNVRKGPFDDPNFRKALAYAVPKELIRDTVFDGRADLGITAISPANEFWFNSNLKPYPHDLKKAREILKEAGYGWDEQERLHYPRL